MSADRAVPQRPLTAMAIALTIGAAALALPRPAPLLAAPAACPSFPELLTVAVARLAPAAANGPMWLALQRVVAALAIASLALLARRASGTWIRAAAIALAAAALPMFDPRYAPGDVLPLLASVWTLHALVASADPANARPPGALIWAGLALLAATAPALAVPLAVVAALAAWPGTGTPALRAARAAGAALAIAAVAVLVLRLVPLGTAWAGGLDLRACVLPWGAAQPASAAQGVMTLLGHASPYVAALAALGAFSARGRLRARRSWPALAFVVLPLVVAVRLPEHDAVRASAPALAGLWLVAAIGLAELAAMCRPTIGGRVAAAGLIVLVPLLRVAAHAREVPRGDVPSGQPSLSLSRMTTLLRALPRGSTLVREDAIADVLVRAIATTADRDRLPRVVRRDAGDVERALQDRTTRVFALPAALADLQPRGFRPRADGAVAQGLTEIVQGGRCAAVTHAWTPLPELTSAQGLSIVAQAESESGPIVIYALTPALAGPGPIGWPPAATRGFNAAVYLRDNEDHRRRLERDLRDDQMPDADAMRAAPIVTRLELWRTPLAPWVLPVTLGVAPTSAVGHVVPPASRLTVCPAYFDPIAPIEGR